MGKVKMISFWIKSFNLFVSIPYGKGKDFPNYVVIGE